MYVCLHVYIIRMYAMPVLISALRNPQRNMRSHNQAGSKNVRMANAQACLRWRLIWRLRRMNLLK